MICVTSGTRRVGASAASVLAARSSANAAARSAAYGQTSSPKLLEETVGVATRVLIAGGGVAALEAALALRALAEDRVSVEMLAPEPQFWYRPLAVAEPFDLGEVRKFELPELAAAAGATFSPGALIGGWAGGRQAPTSAGSSIPYDVLLVACGAGPTGAVPGALTFRGPADTEKIRRLLAEIVAGQVGRVAFVVPWGAVWSLPIYELALMTSAYLAERELDHVELVLVTPEEEPLQLFGRAGSEAVRQLLEERGNRPSDGLLPGRVGGRGAAPRPRGDDRGRPRRRPATPARAAHRRPAADGRGIPARRRARPGARPCRRLRRRRHHQLPGQAGRHRYPAGRRGRRADRGQRRRGPRAAAVPAGAARAAADGTTAALPQARAHRRRGRRLGGQSRAALVAAREDRRPLPGALPRRLRRRREPTRGAGRPGRRASRGRARRRTGPRFGCASLGGCARC